MRIGIKSHPVFKDVKILNFFQFIDARGIFSRKYCENKLGKLNFKIKQINYSKNHKKGTIRGLHFSINPSKEKKIVTCLSGEIFDVVVDMRKKSKTFKKFISIKLTENNSLGLYIPNGFAHGFQTLKNNTNLIYFHSDFYDHVLDRGINPFDKDLNINWPLKMNFASEKDRNLPDMNSKIFNKLYEL